MLILIRSTSQNAPSATGGETSTTSPKAAFISLWELRSVPVFYFMSTPLTAIGCWALVDSVQGRRIVFFLVHEGLPETVSTSQTTIPCLSTNGHLYLMAILDFQVSWSVAVAAIHLTTSILLSWTRWVPNWLQRVKVISTQSFSSHGLFHQVSLLSGLWTAKYPSASNSHWSAPQLWLCLLHTPQSSPQPHKILCHFLFKRNKNWQVRAEKRATSAACLVKWLAQSSPMPLSVHGLLQQSCTCCPWV